MITKYVSEHDFTDALLKDEYAGWSYGATKALYEYYEQLSDDIGEDIELDTVAIRCEFSEYDTCLEYAQQFAEFDTETATDDGLAIGDETAEQVAREWLEERTTVLEAKTPAIGKVDGAKLGDYITSYVIQTF